MNLAYSEMNNQINAITQSGASQGAIRSSILGAGLNRAKALSTGMVDAKFKNIQTGQTKQQFDAGIDQFNVGQDNQEKDINARNKAAYLNNKSKFLSQIGTDAGNIGKEEIFKQIAENMTGYDWLGNYIKANPNATREELIEAANIEMQKKQKTVAAYGGKLKFKKY
jgi:hypothetical protein